ncbi:hypothetical protein M9458_043442 [Cirrhinus mrigala]|uniref:VLIG-type G domain-containing protein n=1 Tax=Cirrhinus mrigala TaxID=683832 RepID=A0ABD0NEJ9_CIRMR
MDVQMAVFHCADSFLKQLMVTKLSQCQYALPLLVPDPFTQEIEFPLWTFRQIYKSWKMKDTNNEIFSKIQPVWKAKTQMVFFFRFGSVSSSKSQLMNSLINDRHNTFFHRNCTGSSKTRLLMDGVVEIAWYCPSGKDTDKFTQCIAFCNLHGDAGDHEKQLQILTEMASINVVILPQLDQNDKSGEQIQELEIGQIYESCQSVNRNKEGLPLAAEMMISGFPLELMDGDAAHVPVVWVTAVLHELIQKLGDKRVFVLSGKSTMLNAMFGLQFARSFHAAELSGRSTRHQDNEIATFVVGLGNLTLINIFGENPSELQDILQIVVQAFMRMKKVNLSPSCVFVHQNVSDVTAGEKNMEGRRRLQHTLDEMTKLAAKDEGSPPMAPPNPSYCENIQELKTAFFSHASKSDGLELTHLKRRINDLWEALLNERFVFSFRNALEIATYRKLETEYSKTMLDIENKLYNNIENETINTVSEIDLQKNLNVKYEEVDKSIIFQKYCQGATSAAIFGEIICQKLKEPIQKSVYKDTARDLTNEIQTNCESLNGNRSKLEKHILKTLAEQEDFDKYVKYFNYPRDHLKSFIRDEVSKYITDEFEVSVRPKMKEKIELVQQKIMKAAQKATMTSGDVQTWLNNFTLQLSDVLIFSVKDLSGVSHEGVDDFKLLEDVISKLLGSVSYEIQHKFSTETFPENLEQTDRPDEILIDHLCQCCWVQCPFCAATCTNTIENHTGDHSVPFHRVDGLTGSCYDETEEYRKAGNIYAEWSITPDFSELPYWKWFVYRFQEDLEKYFEKTFHMWDEISYDWSRYSKEQAIESLDEYI